jgi:tRNA dimethylallyltransferase
VYVREYWPERDMNSNKPILIVIAGPTASGKTALSIEIAKHFDAEIISCDARQFYREMNIGTAKAAAEELAAVKHHFINSRSIEEEYSVGDYEKEVLSFLQEYFKIKKIAVMVGGSGLFMRVVCEGVDVFPEVPIEIRTELQELFNKQGIEILQKELKEKDPHYYEKVDLQNPHRLIRALEVCRASGKSFSSFHGQEKAERPFMVIKIGLNWGREQLYERINRRVDLMMSQGLEEEARLLYPKMQLNALQTVGYQELFSYFEGKLRREEAVEMIKQNSRHYSKRQMTWFKKEKDMIWVNMPENSEIIIAKIEEIINSGS